MENIQKPQLTDDMYVVPTPPMMPVGTRYIVSTHKTASVWRIIGVMALLALAFIPISMLFGVNYDYTLIVVALGGALLGILSGVLGSFAVLRRQSLLGDALSHAALPGVCIAFLFFGRNIGALLIGAGISSLIGVQFIRMLTQTTRIKQDTAMGIILTTWFALGIALLAYIQSLTDASQAGLEKFIFGQAAAIRLSDVILVAVVGTVCMVVLGIFWKELKLMTFDLEFAQANGYPVRFLDAILSLLVVMAVVLGLQLAGVILMVGLLIAPGVAARQWTHNMGQMLTLAGVFGGFSGGAGAVISALDNNLPTGALIIVVATGIVVISVCFAPERGLIWAWRKRRQDAKQFVGA
ncbi:MAG: iron chelate uptake ABC transporter family permease subunit [bacterium]|nr:iron chelate uptake ABC transporter family permease subunit [bacterium]